MKPLRQSSVQAGYKQTEVGVIPEEWAFEPLRFHTLSSAYGPRFSGEHYDERGNIALLRTTDLDDEGNLFLAQMPRAKLPLDQFKAHILLPGDFLVSRSGTCGLSTVFPGYEIPVLPGAFLIRLRFASSVHVGFLKLYFNSEFGKRHLQSLTEGGVQKNIRGSALVELSFPLPLPLEQRAIATALDDVDGLLGGMDRLIAKKRDLKQAAMQQLLTGQTCFPGFHGEWEVKRLGEIADIKTGPFGSSLHESDYVQDGTPIITVEHLGEFGVEHRNLPMVSDHDRQRLRGYSLEVGDIVFSRVGSVDRNALIRPSEAGWLFSGRLLRVRPDRDKAFAQFLSYQFHGEAFKGLVRSVAVGQTMACLNTQILKGIIVKLPSVPEQTAIAKVLTEMDAELAALEQRREKTRALKQAMMQELLTGRIRLVESGKLKVESEHSVKT
ncbi:MAG: restriction endonuclease subunit S [Nitrospira sp.]|nr:restriction endonuclease subunit S [Nitrospira sp.]